MPENAAIVTALIMERPLCVDCLTEKSGARRAAVLDTLKRIERVLRLHREDERRCHGCGEIGPVVFVERPAR